MSHPIRPGTARRLGIRPPRIPVGGILTFPQHLTAEQRSEIERAWLLHHDEWPLPTNRAELAEVFRDSAMVKEITRSTETTERFVRAYAAAQAPPAPRRRWWQRRNR